MAAPEKDYTDPMVHVKDLVNNATLSLLDKTMMLLLVPESDAKRLLKAEIRARTEALKIIADRFPEVDWGGNRPSAPAATASIPTGDTAFVKAPLGYQEDCHCGPCSEYRQFRDYSLN